jgi:hypothetical protein
MKLLTRLLLFAIVNLCVIVMPAQQIIRTNHLGTGSELEIKTEQTVGSVVLRGKGDFPGHVELIAHDHSTQLSPDEHTDNRDSIWTSNLIVFEPPVNKFVIKGLKDGVSFEIITLRLPDVEQQHTPGVPANDCGQPPMVLQAEWRAGLPPPDYDRVFNQVHNLIIHHSATSNALTDYTSLVRSIYTYHTGVNGWSDIGYNYLIAPDGTIFAGRDPGNDMETHQVLGAHFCASNTGTMGICLLGTFMDVAPTAEMTASLIQLISWKTALDSIPPLSYYPHPLDPELPTIAGHRDGCSTLCPGDMVYGYLQSYRNLTQQQLIACGVFLGSTAEPFATSGARIYPNPVSGTNISLMLKTEPLSVQIIDINGRQFPVHYECEQQRLHLTQNLPQGIYLLLIRYDSGVESLKFVQL